MWTINEYNVIWLANYHALQLFLLNLAANFVAFLCILVYLSQVAKGVNWPEQVFCIALQEQVVKKPVNIEVFKEPEGDVLSIDLRIVPETMHVDAMFAPMALTVPSPEK